MQHASNQIPKSAIHTFHQWAACILQGNDWHLSANQCQIASFLDWCKQHRLGPILANKLDQDHPCYSGLNRQLTQAWGQHQLRMVWLKELWQQSPDIDWLLFKGLGSAYCKNLFQQPSLRILGDVDLWVPPAQLPRAIQAAAKLGFQSYGLNQHQRDAANHQGYNHPMVHREHGVLEIHFHLWGDIARGFVNQAMTRAQSITIDGAHLKIAAVADLLILNSTHFWLSTKQMRWLWLYELWQHAQSMDDGQWQQCLHTTKAFGSQCFLLGGMRVWHHLWNLPLSDRLLQVSRELEAMLSPLEKVGLWLAKSQNNDDLRGWPIILTRRLSGRPTRDGWLGLRHRWRPSARSSTKSLP